MLRISKRIVRVDLVGGNREQRCRRQSLGDGNYYLLVEQAVAVISRTVDNISDQNFASHDPYVNFVICCKP